MYMYKKKRTEKYRYVYQHFKFKEILSMNADRNKAGSQRARKNKEKRVLSYYDC